MHPLAEHAPFRYSATDGEFPVEVEGEIPAGLEGCLIRTTPAGLSTDAWQAEHWFDGLCLLYRFDIGPRPGFRARWLASEFARQCHTGRVRMSSFGTRRNPGFWDWLLHPKPPVTDNCNVNIMQHGSDLLALTETQHSLMLDANTLDVTGRYVYGGDIPHSASGLAHPRYHAGLGEIITLCTSLGPTSEVFVAAMRPGSGERRRLNSWSTRRWPYIHDFGLTERFAVIIAHPYTADIRKMLWSRAGFASTIHCDEAEPTRLVVLPLDGGDPVILETEPGFIFHLYNSFERDGEIVMDLVEHQGPDVIDKLYLAALADGNPLLGGRSVRLRLDLAQRRVTREHLADGGCEFPQINYRDRHQRDYRYGYALNFQSDEETADQHFSCAVFKFDFDTGQSWHYGENEWLPGEALFVPSVRTSSGDEDEGYLLTVASHRDREQTSCWILDAKTMQMRARLTVNTLMPLGFHGQFVRGFN